jgi:DnaJ-class molecular chaperone
MTIFAAVLLAAGGYYLSLKIWPYTACSRCKGGGKNAGSNKKRFGHCGKCSGTGRQERLGTRLLLRK